MSPPYDDDEYQECPECGHECSIDDDECPECGEEL